MEKLPAYIVVDVETTGLSFMTNRLHGIGILIEGEAHATYYLFDQVPRHIRDLLANPSVNKIGHNLHAFDAKFIRRAGFETNGEFDDTMVIWNLVDSDSPLGLKFLTELHLGREDLSRKRALDSYIDTVGAGNIAGLCAADLLDPSRPHFPVISDYCCEDVENTRDLYELGMARLRELDEKIKGWGYDKSPLDYYFEEARPLERVLFEIEYRGIKLDLDAIDKLKKEAGEKITANIAELNRLCARPMDLVVEEIYQKKLSTLKTEKGKARVKRGEGKLAFSWQNTGHVASLLFTHCGLGEFRQSTARGSAKLDKAVLEEMAHSPFLSKNVLNVINLYAEYKKWLKLHSTYAGDESKGVLSRAVALPNGESRIYPTYRQTTGTGRLACSNPNMQNLPRESEVKRFFVPDSADEVFDDADYSQIELRVAAHLSGDRTLCGAYNNGDDVHLLTASRLFGRTITKADDLERQAGKRTNFLTIYRGGAWRLQQSLLQDTGAEFSIDECKVFIKKWFDTFPGVLEYLDRQKKTFLDYQCVVAPNGRMRRLPDIRFVKGLEYGGMIWDFDSNLTDEILARWKKANPKAFHIPGAEELGRYAWKLHSHAVKAGYNQPVQGFAASLSKRSVVALHRAGFKIANQVHDSIVISRPRNDEASKKELMRVMETIAPLRVPIGVDCKTLLSFHPGHKPV